MNKPSKCLVCSGTIPATRKRSARYCSNEHYYVAKKQRSISRYSQIKLPHDEIKRNDKILSTLYWIQESTGSVYNYSQLEDLGFNFGICAGDVLGNNKRIWKKLDKFAYRIDPHSKNISLWKLQ